MCTIFCSAKYHYGSFHLDICVAIKTKLRLLPFQGYQGIGVNIYEICIQKQLKAEIQDLLNSFHYCLHNFWEEINNSFFSSTCILPYRCYKKKSYTLQSFYLHGSTFRLKNCQLFVLTLGGRGCRFDCEPQEPVTEGVVVLSTQTLASLGSHWIALSSCWCLTVCVLLFAVV